MAVIKRTFTAGKMNKDLDERLVPNGQYRDAYNIEVRTTSDGNSGSVQNVKGNHQVGDTSPSAKVSGSTCVGSVVDEKNNVGYFLFASEDINTEDAYSFDGTYVKYIDYIIEQKNAPSSSPVVVDAWGVLVNANQITAPTSSWNKLAVTDTSIYEVGMEITGFNSDGSLHPITGSKIIGKDQIGIFLDKEFSSADFTGLASIFAKKPKVLEFYQDKKITGINVIDGFLTWTTDYSEPKKINIERCKEGTSHHTSPTVLYVNSNGTLVPAGDDIGLVLKENILDNSDLSSASAGAPLNWELSTGATYSEANNAITLGSNSEIVYKPDYYRSLNQQVRSIVEYGKTYTIKINVSSVSGDDETRDLKLSSVTLGYLGTQVYGNIDVFAVGNKTFTFTARSGMINLQSSSGGVEISSIQIDQVSDGETTLLSKNHITLIRKSPKTPPTTIENLEPVDVSKKWNIGSYSGFVGSAGFAVGEGSSGVIPNVPSTVSFAANETLKVTSYINGEPYSVIIKVTDVVDSKLYYYVLSINSKITTENNNWIAELDFSSKGLFENQFVRFATRYIYSDGEYSTFSPWSQPVFSPGELEYNSKDGYNLGMVNRVKEITLKDLVPKKPIIPDDVVAVDVLFKSSESPAVYIVKTISKGLDGEWLTGEMAVKNEMMHELVSSDQSLRVWDNVPKTAKAQEIIGNRLVLANYTQGYDIDFKPSVQQYLKSEDEASTQSPTKSIKSMRSYKVGVVFGDEFGRETPVIAVNNKSYKDGDNVYSKSFDSFYVDKSLSKKKNSIVVKQDWSQISGGSKTPQPWMDYAKYYIKETSQEYYNLVMDRWYPAEDGNVWLAFSSSDRNKVDEETFLVLKNAHGSDEISEELIKHKVISISNEAPKSVKSTLRSLAKFTIPEDYYEVNSDDDLNNLIEKTELLVSRSDYNASTGGDDISFKGNPKVRLVLIVNGTRYTTALKDLVSFKKPKDDPASDGKITIASTFGQGANFYKSLVNDGLYTSVANAKASIDYGTNINITYEFLDEVVEDKAEYEGKFFVKIAKNNEVRNLVMNSDPNTDRYELAADFGIGFINSRNSTNPYTGPKNNYTWGTNTTWNSQTISFSSSEINNDDNFAQKTPQNVDKTAKFWRDFTRKNTDSDPARSAIFIDESHYYEGYILGGNRGGQSKHGGEALYASPNCVQGVDVIKFSVPVLPLWKQGSTSDSEGITMLTKQGAVFSFADDPKSIKYRVRRVESYKLDNYGDDDTNYYTAQPDNASVEYVIEGNSRRTERKVYKATLKGSWTQRTQYKVYFERLSDKGVIVPLSGLELSEFDPRGYISHDGTDLSRINVYKTASFSDFNKDTSAQDPAVWETDPKPGTELDIYYEASQAIPMVLKDENVYNFISKESEVRVLTANSDGSYDYEVIDGELSVEGVTGEYVNISEYGTYMGTPKKIDIDDLIEFTNPNGTITRTKVLGLGSISDNGWFTPHYSYDKTGSTTAGNNVVSVSSTANIQVGMKIIAVADGVIPKGAVVDSIDSNAGTVTISSSALSTGSQNLKFVLASDTFKIDKEVYKYQVELPWFNCFSFGNGLESNRIRDDFNAPTISNGVKVSTTFLGYGEEKKYNGLIYSGIINSSSKTNKMNEFNMGQKITKDINPDYGSIQIVKSRNSDLNVFTQDKVLKVLANKDALYNADGNVNITSTDRVLGQAIPYAGDFGISEDPTSLAWDQYRMYFTDKQRGAVLRLSNDGLTPISNVGMSAWFRENLRDSKDIIGSFDVVSGEYNLTLKTKAWKIDENNPTAGGYTLSFSEASKGWVSFKSFIQDDGVSFDGDYFTVKDNKIWKHNSDISSRTSFYQIGFTQIESGNTSTSGNVSRINVLLNDMPSSVKSFKTVEYEGSQGEIRNEQGQTTDVNGNTIEYSDGRYDAVNSSSYLTKGWETNIETDLGEGACHNFTGKEGKWFGNIKGKNNILNINSNKGIHGIGTPKPGSAFNVVESNLNRTAYQKSKANIDIQID